MSDPHSEAKRDHLEATNSQLRNQLAEIRRRRRKVQTYQNQVNVLVESLLHRQNQVLQQQGDLLVELETIVNDKKETEKLIHLSRCWSILNDCFHISAQGPFGTINGLRLGSEIITFERTIIADQISENGALQQQQQPPTPSPSRGGYLSLTASRNTTNSPSTSVVKVPWAEINAALGQLTLLLTLIQQRANLRYRHDLLPCGSTSKIGIRRGENTTATTIYNLYSDDSFQLFGRRNFNVALQGLVQCVADAGDYMQTIDPTIAFPHSISYDNRGDVLIANIRVAYDNNNTVEWTRAMKYLLTNVKYVVLFDARRS